MRLASVLDSLYVLSTLSGGSTSPQVCAASSRVRPAAYAAISVPVLRTSAAVTAFVDVNVVPMDQERVLTHQTVVVEGERITALGPVSKIKVPAGAVRVDGRGKYLLPGLGDMHWHDYAPAPAGDHEKKAWQAKRIHSIVMGVTAVRTLAEGRGWSSTVDDLRKIRQEFANGEFPSPRVYLPLAFPSEPTRIAAGLAERLASAKAAGRDSLPLGMRLTPPESLAAHVAAAKAAGYDHIALPYPRIRSAADRVFLDSLVAAARRAGLPISAHAHNEVAEFPLEAALALGPAGGAIEHTSMVAQLAMGLTPKQSDTSSEAGKEAWANSVWAAMHTVPMAKLRAVAAALKRAGVWVDPTMECERRGGGGAPLHPQVLRVLHAAGVPLLLSSDLKATVQIDLLGMVEQAGFSPYQALLTGTRNVATYFRRQDDLGTVAAGKLADLVLLYGNPLADITQVWEPAGVMLGGRWLDRTALDQALFTTSDAPSPWHWIVARVHELGPAYRKGGPLYPLTAAQTQQFMVHHARLVALGDSLTALPPSEKPAAEQLRQRLAGEFGAMRARLTPEQRTTFDPLVRMWLREQARQGFQVTVLGVRPRPSS